MKTDDELGAYYLKQFFQKLGKKPFIGKVDYEGYEIRFESDSVYVDDVKVPLNLNANNTVMDDDNIYDTIWMKTSPREREAFRVFMRFQRTVLSKRFKESGN